MRRHLPLLLTVFALLAFLRSPVDAQGVHRRAAAALGELAAGPIAGRALAESGRPEHLAALTPLVHATRDPHRAAVLLQWIDHGFRGRAEVELPAALVAAINAVPDSESHDPRTQVRRMRIKMRGGDPKARSAARGFLKYDDERLDRLRVEVISVLEDIAAEDMIEILVVLARDSKRPPVRRAALMAMQRYGDPGVAGRVASFLPGSPEKHTAAELLTRRLEWSRELVKTIAEGRISFDTVPPELVPRLRSWGDAEIDSYVSGVWGSGKVEGEEERLRNALRVSARPDLGRGELVYLNHCARCHGQGFAPPLETLPRDGLSLVESLSQPSQRIEPEWAEIEVWTKDGRLITGRAVENSRVVTIEDTQGQRTSLRRTDVDRIAPSAVSRMPAGLTLALTDGELSDLLAWLTAR